MRAFLLLAVLASSLAVAACGKKGNLEAPPPDPAQAEEGGNG
jgi:predicted small lipoprotein YifL